MEYGELVAYYREKLMERYKAAAETQEMQQIREKLRSADAETLKKVLDLLDKQKG